MKSQKITEIIEELEFKAKIYPTLPVKHAREVYDQYINLIIEQSDFTRAEKENLVDYWESIKDEY